jgi:Fic family protein
MVHPFNDGNGRVGREVLNHMLTRAGFPRLVVALTDREKYLNALQSGNQERYNVMLADFIDILEDNRASVFDEILGGKLG